MKLIIVRHGETVANLKRICQGQTHGMLNENGFKQAKYTGLALRNEKIDVCYSSDLNRAMQTAQEIVKFHPSLPIVTDERLRERYFGSFQGQTFPENIDDFTPSDEIETPQAMAIRLNNFLKEISLKHTNDTILIVSHGFTIRTLFTLFYNVSPEKVTEIEDIKNTSISIVTFDENAYQVLLKNDISHARADFSLKRANRFEQ